MDKHQVKIALKQKMDSLNLSGNKAAALIGISSANVSNILNSKWESISEAIWKRVAVFAGMSSEWQPARTANLVKIYAICNDAQTNHVSLAFSFNPGSGKSFTLKHYANNKPNVAYVECDELWTKKIFLKEIAASLGITAEGSVYELTKTIVDALDRMSDPLVIIDEADKLKDPVLSLFKTLYNRTDGRCGFVLSGAPFFKIRINKGVDKNKQAFREIFSRLGGEFIPLTPVSNKDIQAVCMVNGVTDDDDIARITREANADLRQVSRMIHKIKNFHLKQAV